MTASPRGEGGDESGASTVRVDKALCASFGRCVALAPEAFTFDENDQAEPTAKATNLDAQRLRAVADACPTGAITVSDPE